MSCLRPSTAHAGKSAGMRSLVCVQQDVHPLPMMPANAPLAAPELHQLAARGAPDDVQFVQARMYALLPALHFQMGWLASAHHCIPHKHAGLLPA